MATTHLPTSMMPPPRSQAPIIMLVVMVVLFAVLVSILVKDYSRSFAAQQDEQIDGESRPATAPATRPSIDDGLPREVGFSQRNLDFGGNLGPVLAKNGEPLDMDETIFRVANDLRRVNPARFAERTTQLPLVKSLLANPDGYCGMAFTLRCVPAEISEFANNVPERVASWRIYAMAQRDTDEFFVLESLDPPPMKEWTLKRDVIEIDALYLRNASYETVKGKIVTVPYFLAKNYRKVLEDARPTANPGIGALLTSRFGPFVGAGILVLVLLTVWTLKRHGRQVEKQERDHFYALLRARTKKAAAASHAASQGPAEGPTG